MNFLFGFPLNCLGVDRKFDNWFFFHERFEILLKHFYQWNFFQLWFFPHVTKLTNKPLSCSLTWHEQNSAINFRFPLRIRSRCCRAKIAVNWVYASLKAFTIRKYFPSRLDLSSEEEFFFTILATTITFYMRCSLCLTYCASLSQQL